MTAKVKIEDALKRLAEQEINVYAYAGPIELDGYIAICKALDKARDEGRRKQKAILFLSTYGGDPNAGYRIARAMIHHYGAENFSVAVPTACKSAGTLICIGAHNLIFFDSGELGPLDVQIQKQDEIFQRNSGLDILRGMTYLQGEALASFKRYLFDINRMGGISTKIAAEIAGSLVKGLYTPIFAQIDPLKLGEMNAALQIANEYGSRLNEKSKSLKELALSKLTNSYPAHSFVVDRSEAKTLFERVESPNANELSIGDFAISMFKWASGKPAPIVFDLNEFFPSTDASKEVNNEHIDNSPGNDAVAEHDNAASPINAKSAIG